MRFVIAAGLACVALANAQNNTPTPPREDPTLRIEVDSQLQKPSALPFVEYMNATAELLKALAWPAILGTLVITQRRPL
jgi:hypothetical protein